MTPREALLRAAELVELGHTKGASARDASGGVVLANSPCAVCFCALGAMRAATCGLPTEDEQDDAFFAARGVLLGYLDRDTTVPWNDAPERTQADVVQALRAAAETCT